MINYAYACVKSDPSDRAVLCMGVRPFPCWDCGFKSRRGMNIFFLQGRDLCDDPITRPEKC
jgi:hypothetical protein